MRLHVSQVYLGEGFLLRPFAEDDALELTNAINESRAHLEPWMVFVTKEPQTLHRSLEFIKRAKAERTLEIDFTFGIFHVDGRSLLGATGYHLRGRALESRYAEIGMWIRASESGRGLGTKVLQALERWSIREWPWLRLEWRCDSRNTASQRTAVKAGFFYEGELRCDRMNHRGEWINTFVYSKLKYDPADVTGPFDVRPLGQGEVARIVQLHRDSWLDTFLGIFDPKVFDTLVPDRLEEGWNKRLLGMGESKNFLEHFGIANRDGTLLGLCSIGEAREIGSQHAAELYMMLVPRIYQKKGLGSGMLRHAARRFELRGYKSFFLWCAEDNHWAIEFYQRLGGVLDGHSHIRDGAREVSIVFHCEGLNHEST